MYRVSRGALMEMVFKLAKQNWRTLKGHALLGDVIEGGPLQDGR